MYVWLRERRSPGDANGHYMYETCNWESAELTCPIIRRAHIVYMKVIVSCQIKCSRLRCGSEASHVNSAMRILYAEYICDMIKGHDGHVLISMSIGITMMLEIFYQTQNVLCDSIGHVLSECVADNIRSMGGDIP